MADPAVCAAGGSRRREKPEIYKASNGRVVVEDELLNFLVVKMHTLTQDEIVVLVANNFSSEWIEDSKRILFEVCPKTTQRNIAHKGPQKDINNIKACIKVLNECGVNIPRFVSYYLDDLPVVGFGSMDASALLSRVEKLNREVLTMRKVLQEQTNVCENLRLSTENINHRVAEIEQSRTAPEVATGECALQEESAGMSSWSTAPAAETLDPVSDHVYSNVPAESHALTREWTTVVKEGRRVKRVPQSTADKNISATRRERKKATGITGTCTGSSIQVVTTKLVSLFVTRFDPALEAGTLREYLIGKLNNASVTCKKIATMQSRYSSFHVTAECNDIAVMYDPDLWPAGTYIRRYYELRKTGGAHRPRDLGQHSVGQLPAVQEISCVDHALVGESSYDHA